MEEKLGDILVFLTGQDEIESVERLVQERLQHLPEDKRKLLPLTIFSALPSEQQMQAFAPAPTGFRKVREFQLQFAYVWRFGYQLC